MAKSRIDEWLESDKLILLEGWARDGLTQEQIAHNMGIGLTTLKALGYNVPLRKAFKVKEVIYENGKRLKETERIEYANEEMHISADTTAQIFWLKNRKKKEWRDKIEYETNSDDLNKVKELLSKIKDGAKNE